LPKALVRPARHHATETATRGGRWPPRHDQHRFDRTRPHSEIAISSGEVCLYKRKTFEEGAAFSNVNLNSTADQQSQKLLYRGIGRMSSMGPARYRWVGVPGGGFRVFGWHGPPRRGGKHSFEGPVSVGCWLPWFPSERSHFQRLPALQCLLGRDPGDCLPQLLVRLFPALRLETSNGT
jgi:hypothetical protein